MTMISGGRIVTPDGILADGWLQIDGRTIARLGSGEPPEPRDHELDGAWVVPGFVDIHVHGGGRASYVPGDQDQAVTAAALHRQHGTTTTMASLVSGTPDSLVAAVSELAELVEDGVLAGIHLEGPFLSVKRCGAHDPALLIEPEPEVVRGLLDAGRGAVKMVTLAAELPYATDAVALLAGEGVIGAIGHTDASYDETRAAIGAGATVATHLFNAMRPVHHREPGPIPALLEDERVTVELICDGVHLHPAIVRMAIGAAGADRVVLVTDAMDAAGAGDGNYVLGDLAVQVIDGVARLVDGGAIAGSTLTMDRAFRFVVEAGVSVPDAVRMSAGNPARLLGLTGQVGELRSGLDADLVVLDGAFELRAVMAKGQWVDVP
ncbi:MAG TPA: N-acetylglucosamine-6-phosphate deacetylase [Jiangellaceae bacterium]|nr:N-acetylglucosamine-6-phosphate deacetylase [Jiangellaceae bacterium]